ncbi:hypothetical protein GCM10011515_06020 [Tsuneonella deserti]|uniref:TIGR02588 family protein n=1 Tax=Tsuneonella deserti TaxID=2035528 RepID=A0ABQ1S0X8_9SPHN|nr:hypothetical protein [Tsuneonella deserti]GGD89148.1 hypothetical protein GCM10011515_06020 [Tsuneonella deserti]
MNQDAHHPDGSAESRRRKDWLEWIAGGIGLLLAILLIGTIGYEAAIGNREAAPVIRFEIASVEPAGQFYLVEIEARNISESTAQQVEVEATLTNGGRETEKAVMTFDYVPGQSTVKGGVFFTNDPRAGNLQIRPLGYSQP